MKQKLANIANRIEKKQILLIASLDKTERNRIFNLLNFLKSSGVALIFSGAINQNLELANLPKEKVDTKGLFRCLVPSDPIVIKKLTDYVLSKAPHVSLTVVWDNGKLPRGLLNNLEKVSESLKIPFLYIADGFTNSPVKSTLNISETNNNSFPSLVISNKSLKLRLNKKDEKRIYFNKTIPFEQIVYIALMGTLKGFYSEACFDYLKKCIND